MTSAKRGAHRLTRVCTDAHTRGFTGVRADAHAPGFAGVRADAHARMRTGSLGSAQFAIAGHRGRLTRGCAEGAVASRSGASPARTRGSGQLAAAWQGLTPSVFKCHSLSGRAISLPV